MLHERDAEGDSDDGWVMYERARHIFERVEPDHLHVAMVLYNLASHHESQSEFVVAERYYRRALQQRIMEDYDDHLPWVLLQYPWVGEKVHEEQDELNKAVARDDEEATKLAREALDKAMDVRRRNVIEKFTNAAALELRNSGGKMLESKCPRDRQTWKCTEDGKDVILKELKISKASTAEWKRQEIVLSSSLVSTYAMDRSLVIYGPILTDCLCLQVHPFLVEADRLTEDSTFAQFKYFKSTLRSLLPDAPNEAGESGIVAAQIPDAKLKGLLLQLVMALYHIHDDQPPNFCVVHGNLSPENCMLDEEEADAGGGEVTTRLMVADFRVGKPVTNRSFLYAAPELSNRESLWYDFEPDHEACHDMYSLGLIMFEAAFGCQPPRKEVDDTVVWDKFTFAAAAPADPNAKVMESMAEVPVQLRAVRQLVEQANQADVLDAPDVIDAQERDAFGTLVTELLSHNPRIRPVASELLLSAYFASNALRTAVAANLHTTAALAALPLHEVRAYDRKVADVQLTDTERSSRVGAIRRQYRRAMQTYSTTRDQVYVPARYALQHAADLQFPPLVGSCVIHDRAAQEGVSHGTFGFWKRVAEIYSSAFPQRADILDGAYKQIEYIRKQALADDAETNEDDLRCAFRLLSDTFCGLVVDVDGALTLVLSNLAQSRAREGDFESPAADNGGGRAALRVARRKYTRNHSSSNLAPECLGSMLTDCGVITGVRHCA